MWKLSYDYFNHKPINTKEKYYHYASRQVYEQSASQTKKITLDAVKSEDGEENRIVYESLYGLSFTEYEPAADLGARGIALPFSPKFFIFILFFGKNYVN